MAANFALYQRAARCTGHAQRGSLVLLKVIMAKVPGTRNGGCYVCRDIRGKFNLSLHAEGRAVDVRCNIATGAQVVKMLLPAVGRLGIQCIIHNRRIYSRKEPNGKAYHGVNPHYDHVHIELGWPAALRLTGAAATATLAGKIPPAVHNTDRGPDGMFPLPVGHWYGPDDGTLKSHSGLRPADREAIKAIQREIGAQQSGRFDAPTVSKSSAWKHANGQPSDPLVGLATWNRMRQR